MSTSVHHWKEWPEDCPKCGNPLQVFTVYREESWAGDGDVACCADPECGTRGQIRVQCDEGEACAWAEFSG
jgi:hypothetical protein